MLVLHRRFRSSTGKYGQKKPVFLHILQRSLQTFEENQNLHLKTKNVKTLKHKSLSV